MECARQKPLFFVSLPSSFPRPGPTGAVGTTLRGGRTGARGAPSSPGHLIKPPPSPDHEPRFTLETAVPLDPIRFRPPLVSSVRPSVHGGSQTLTSRSLPLPPASASNAPAGRRLLPPCPSARLQGSAPLHPAAGRKGAGSATFTRRAR